MWLMRQITWGWVIGIGMSGLGFARNIGATTYEVGPGKSYTNISDVSWATLAAGDTVLIYWRSTPYKEKWVINRQGTAGNPITVRGVPGTDGQRPVVDGDGATTSSALNFWNEERGAIKIGGSNIPPDGTPAYIVVENLDIKSARPAYTFTGRNGLTTYATNAAAIYIEKGQHLVVRNCVMHDCGNGFFCAPGTTNLLVEGCYIYGNGNEGSIYEHNNYTEASGITFQNNRFGPLRAGCLGNNLKDRSAGTVIRYNWIEGGNRALDLVDSAVFNTQPGYTNTFVYGNILIKHDDTSNNQVVHYGGDSGTTSQYRKGTLWFYNNTVVSDRAGNTTLFQLQTNDEHADSRNNLFYVTAAGNKLALSGGAGVLDYRNNWFKPGYADSFSTLTGTNNNLGGNITGSAPGFRNETAQDYHLTSTSACVNAGTTLAAAALPLHDQYVPHQQRQPRPVVGPLDIGAFEFSTNAALIQSVTLGGADLLLSFDTESNVAYSVERRDDLRAGDWTNLIASVPGTGGIVTVTNTGAAGLPHRFYRVKSAIP